MCNARPPRRVIEAQRPPENDNRAMAEAMENSRRQSQELISQLERQRQEAEAETNRRQQELAAERAAQMAAEQAARVAQQQGAYATLTNSSPVENLQTTEVNAPRKKPRDGLRLGGTAKRTSPGSGLNLGV